MKAEEYINLGYQRLTTFEVQSSGGFSLFGEAPADRMLTAYGLQEFSDMSRVHHGGPGPDAPRRRLADRRSRPRDGSWENDRGLVHENTWSSLGNDRLPVTAYITWSLIDAGFGDEAATPEGPGLPAREPITGPGCLRGGAAGQRAGRRRPGQAAKSSAPPPRPCSTAWPAWRSATGKRSSGRAAWPPSWAARARPAAIETTALAAYALLRAGCHPELANAALAYLIGQKDSYGTWYSTQATVLSLKALIQSVRAGGEKANASVTLSLNGGQERTLQVTPENFDVVQQVSFEDVNIGRGQPGGDRASSGEGNLMYQVTGSYYLPWDKLALYPDLAPQEDLVTHRCGLRPDRAGGQRHASTSR